MKTIRLDRKNHVLYAGDSSTDIDKWINIIMFYDVSYVVKRGKFDGYDIYSEDRVLGYIIDVENVEEQW